MNFIYQIFFKMISYGQWVFIKLKSINSLIQSIIVNKSFSNPSWKSLSMCRDIHFIHIITNNSIVLPCDFFKRFFQIYPWHLKLSYFVQKYIFYKKFLHFCSNKQNFSGFVIFFRDIDKLSKIFVIRLTPRRKETYNKFLPK